MSHGTEFPSASLPGDGVRIRRGVAFEREREGGGGRGVVGGGAGGEEKKHESKSDVKVNPSKSVKDATVTGEGEEKETSSDVTSKAAFCDEKMTVAFPLPLHPPPSTPPSRLFLSFFFHFQVIYFSLEGGGGRGGLKMIIML